MSYVELSSAELSVKIHPKGAELQSLFSLKHQLELLWQADASFWPRHAPVLFPIVGRLRNDNLRYKGKSYPLGQHGFARDKQFELIHHSGSYVQFSLISDEDTLRIYPFRFELVVEYYLRDNKLTTSYVIRNNHDDILPFSIGGHPAFNWPLNPAIEKSSHYVKFSSDESQDIRQLNSGLMSITGLPCPIENQHLSLQETLFNNDALIFDRLKSRRVSFHATEDFAIHMSFEDFPHFGLWTKPSANFLCLEPWSGYASPIDFDGEFEDKPGVRILPPYSECSLSYDIEFESP